MCRIPVAVTQNNALTNLITTRHFLHFLMCWTSRMYTTDSFFLPIASPCSNVGDWWEHARLDAVNYWWNIQVSRHAIWVFWLTCFRIRLDWIMLWLIWFSIPMEPNSTTTNLGPKGLGCLLLVWECSTESLVQSQRQRMSHNHWIPSTCR